MMYRVHCALKSAEHEVRRRCTLQYQTLLAAGALFNLGALFFAASAITQAKALVHIAAHSAFYAHAQMDLLLSGEMGLERLSALCLCVIHINNKNIKPHEALRVQKWISIDCCSRRRAALPTRVYVLKCSLCVKKNTNSLSLAHGARTLLFCLRNVLFRRADAPGSCGVCGEICAACE